MSLYCLQGFVVADFAVHVQWKAVTLSCAGIRREFILLEEVNLSTIETVARGIQLLFQVF